MNADWVRTDPTSAAAHLLATWLLCTHGTRPDAAEGDARVHRPQAPSGRETIGGPVEPGTAHEDLSPAQHDGLDHARSALETWGGTLIADGVGLGKTRIALALAAEAVRAGRMPAARVPASLRDRWRTDGRKAGIEPRNIQSHNHLARHGLGRDTPGLLIVDEAHAFRNPRTLRYRALAAAAARAPVVLLTATPINNSLWDLYFLIRTFAGDGAFSHLGVPSLATAFRDAAARPADRLPLGLARAIDAVTVRRTRADWVAKCSELPIGLRFPERAPPRAMFYDLAAMWSGRLDDLLADIEALELGAFDGPPDGPASRTGALLRLTLLKRLESSPRALRLSIDRLQQALRTTRDGLDAGGWIAPGAARRLAGANLDQLALPGPILLAPVASRAAAAALAASTDRDLDRIVRLRVAASRADDATRDAKLRTLRGLLDGPLRLAKTLLFTEYRDTAAWLARCLAARGGIARIDGKHAFLGMTPAPRAAVIHRFAPRASGRPEPPGHEAVSVLIATDVLAEGLDLQDAAAVISYDLPWNPVRLVQRIGRIDRLGSPHERVESFNLLPDRGLEATLGLLRRLHVKLDAVARTLGTDGAILPSDTAGPATAAGRCDTDTERAVRALARGDPALLDRIEAAASLRHPLIRRVEQALVGGGRKRLQRVHGPLLGLDTGDATLSGDATLGWIVLGRRDGHLTWFAAAGPGACTGSGWSALTDETAIERLTRVMLAGRGRRGFDGGQAPGGDRLCCGTATYESTSTSTGPSRRQRRTDGLPRPRRLATRLPWPDKPHPASGGTGHAALRRLHRCLRHLHTPDPHVCDRIDRLGSRLLAGLPVDPERRIRSAIAAIHDEASLLAALDRIESILPPAREHAPTGPAVLGAVRVPHDDGGSTA